MLECYLLSQKARALTPIYARFLASRLRTFIGLIDNRRNHGLLLKNSIPEFLVGSNAVRSLFYFASARAQV